MNPESGLRLSRVLICVFMVVLPLFGYGAINMVLLIAAALTVYDGFHRATVYGTAATLVIMELLYGLDSGVLSVSYVAAVALLVLISKFVTLPPWVLARGWRIADAIRAFVVAYVFAALMTAGSVLLGRVLYGYMDTVARLAGEFHGGWYVLVPICIAVALILVRRIDEPFRAHITFGT